MAEAAQGVGDGSGVVELHQNRLGLPEERAGAPLADRSGRWPTEAASP
jgi:hypothetical protein